jgi:hypothetical protein
MLSASRSLLVVLVTASLLLVHPAIATSQDKDKENHSPTIKVRIVGILKGRQAKM